MSARALNTRMGDRKKLQTQHRFPKATNKRVVLTEGTVTLSSRIGGTKRLIRQRRNRALLIAVA